MASLVAPLVSGISTAASGSVSFLLQGTSTVAPVYSDPEGATAVTAHTLDARGAIVRYVEARVDIVVRDVNGAEVVSFTWGTDARDARVENLGWTGPSATGATVAGGRITVDTVLTRLHASLGTTDGNVSVNGVAQTLSAAISSGVFYNVKTYGAQGDGTATDTVAVQAAINAATDAGGGIVYFPDGTYKLGPVIVPDASGKLFFLGSSPSSAILQQQNTQTLLDLGDNNNIILMSLTLAPSAIANTGTLLLLGGATTASAFGCVFSNLDGTLIAMDAVTPSRAVLFACVLSHAGGSSSRIASGNGSFLKLASCRMATGSPDLTSFSDSLTIDSIGSEWTLGAAIAAGTSVVLNNASGTLRVVGGQVSSLFTSGTVTICAAGTLVASGTTWSGAGATMTLSSGGLYESGCFFTGATPPTVGTPTSGLSATRNNQVVLGLNGAANNYTPNAAYGVHEVISSAAAMTFNNPTGPTVNGWPLVLVYKNNGSGGNVTPSFGTAYVMTTAAVAIANNAVAVYVFAPRTSDVTADWILCSTTSGAVP